MIGTISCIKKDPKTSIDVPNEGDFIIFGNIYGACTGDCRDIYMLTKEALYKDSDELTDRLVYTFDPDTLSPSQFLLADTLWDIPNSVIMEETPREALIQQIADFDYHVSGRIAENQWSIRFDKIDSTLAPELHTYHKVLKEVIEGLR